MKRVVIFVLALVTLFGIVGAAADFDVNNFDCTPSENAVGDYFSCTLQIKNNGDVSGSVNELRLYPDENDWLEQSNYLQTSGTSVSPGQTTEITFSGLRATKAGSSNSFARVTLDNVEDTGVSEILQMNVIDVGLIVENSETNRAIGQTFTASSQLTAGGNIDAILTLAVISGGCSIGNQDAQKSILGLSHQEQWVPTEWMITQGGSGDCKFAITATALGTNEIASKINTVSSTIDCTDCPEPSSGGSSSGSGSGGAGGGGGVLYNSLIGETSFSLSNGRVFGFLFGEDSHTITAYNITETSAQIVVRSEEKSILMYVGDKINIDFENDGVNEISIELKTINILTQIATLIVTPLYTPEKKSAISDVLDKIKGDDEKSPEDSIPWNDKSKEEKVVFSLEIIGLVILAFMIIFAIASYFRWVNYKNILFRRSVVVKGFKNKT